MGAIALKVMALSQFLLEDISVPAMGVPDNVNRWLCMTILKKFLPWLIFIVGCGISAGLAIYVDQQNDREVQVRFNQHVREFEAAIVKNLASYDDILFGVAGMYLAGQDVTPEQFRIFGENLKALERYAALKSINFARHVDATNRVQQLEKLGNHIDREIIDSAISSLPKSRRHFMIITRVFPPGSMGLGQDLFASYLQNFPKSRDEDFWIAIRDSEPNKVISSGLPIIRPGQRKPGFAARMGIFKKDMAGRPILVGTAGVGFQLEEFFNETVPKRLADGLQFRLVNVRLANGKIPPRPISIFESERFEPGHSMAKAGKSDLLTMSFDFQFGGALLRMTVQEARNKLIAERYRILPIFIFLAGLLLISSLTMLASYMLHQNELLENAVRKKTIDLQQELERSSMLERQIEHATAEERRRIGRELHDDLGQRLTGISLSAEALTAKLSPISPEMATHADSLERAASEAMVHMRALARNLLPVATGPEGLREALAALVQEVSCLTGVPCTFEYEDPVDIDNEDVAVNLFRIAQEALNNAIRHANPSMVVIYLDYVDDKVELSIADDGIGFDPGRSKDDDKNQGMGLNIMRYRANLSGFALSLTSSDRDGTIIKVSEC